MSLAARTPTSPQIISPCLHNSSCSCPLRLWSTVSTCLAAGSSLSSVAAPGPASHLPLCREHVKEGRRGKACCVNLSPVGGVGVWLNFYYRWILTDADVCQSYLYHPSLSLLFLFFQFCFFFPQHNDIYFITLYPKPRWFWVYLLYFTWRQWSYIYIYNIFPDTSREYRHKQVHQIFYFGPCPFFFLRPVQCEQLNLIGIVDNTSFRAMII